MDSNTLTLPWPPSLNGYKTIRITLPRSWGPVVKHIVPAAMWPKLARMFVANSWYPTAMPMLTKRGTQYKLDVHEIVLRRFGFGLKPLECRLAVQIKMFAPSRRRTDLDNHAKVALDSLTMAKVWGDDSQIDDLHLIRGRVQSPGWLEVRITRIADADQQKQQELKLVSE